METDGIIMGIFHDPYRSSNKTVKLLKMNILISTLILVDMRLMWVICKAVNFKDKGSGADNDPATIDRDALAYPMTSNNNDIKCLEVNCLHCKSETIYITVVDYMTITIYC